MSLEKLLEQVASFHHLIGELISANPILLAGDRKAGSELACELRNISVKYSNQRGNRLVSRAAMAIEELAEWLEAHSQEDLVEATDALADRLFVLLGDAVATGIPLEGAFELVSQSNLTKVASKTTNAGKGVKSAEFQCPKESLAKLLTANR